MYINRHHQFRGQEDALVLIEAFPLGAWVYRGTTDLTANHIPFYLDRSRGPLGTLVGHVSRANRIWRELDERVPSIVMFQQAQAYITPGWYPGKKEHGEVVPTWDYAVAHVHGIARAVEDRDWMLSMLERLTDMNEAGQPMPWRVSDAPPAFIEKLMRAIVGIEIPVDRIEGKLKASQDEAMQDRIGTVQGLLQTGSNQSGAMAALVRQAIDTDLSSEIY